MNSASGPFLQRLASSESLISVELRPPRLGVTPGASMELWMEMNATIRRLVAQDTMLFLTDGAVGSREEENLHHLVTNLDPEISRAMVCPFLTTKHTLEYCDWYTARAVDSGAPALTVLGGDKGVGAPRCVPHGYLLRQRIRKRFPDLALGGWANPHGDVARQVGYLAAEEAHADFFLTQLVSHHDMAPVDRFLAETERVGLRQPGIFGVFYYRSARRKTLERLAPFFPVPVEGLVHDFVDLGLSPEEVCARTISALHKRGVTKVYISNLHGENAVDQLMRIRELVDAS